MTAPEAVTEATASEAPRTAIAPPRRAPWLAVARVVWVVVALVAVGLFIASLPGYLLVLNPGMASGPSIAASAPVVAGMAVLGVLASMVAALMCLLLAAVLFRRTPDNAMALFVSFYLLAYGIVLAGPVERLAALHPGWHWRITTVFMIQDLLFTTPMVILLVLFPTGRFVPRWTRWLPPVSGLLMLLTVRTDPFADGGPRTPAVWVLVATWSIPFIAALYAQIYRYRFVSNPSEQRQTKFVVFGVIVWVVVATLVGIPFFWLLGLGPNVLRPWWAPVGEAVWWLSLDIVPVALTIAVLRYGLWAIDIIINRTLVYGALTSVVVGLYMLVVGAVGTILQARGNVLISLGATGVVALVFHPLQDYLQRGVNRLLYGDRDDPYAVLTRLGSRLEATLVAEEVLPTIVATVREALKLPYAAITLRHGEQDAIAAAAGELPPARAVPPGVGRPERADERTGLLVLALVYQQEAVGQLLLAPRAHGETFSPADLRLLADLARQAGVAAHAVRMTLDRQRLTVDLQQSREQLITAREEERRRLRRDLHDGVGPTLASLVQRIDTVRTLVADEPAAATAMLDELKGQVKATIGDIRRLVYALRPPALDEFGLVSAIREHAAHYNESQGLRVAIDAPDVLPPLSAAVEVAAYRIVLEALTNVVRHAQAHRCCIRLDLADGLCLEITDDGVGLPPDVCAGVGLASMRERAAELGGDYRIEPMLGGGTRVCARLPLATHQPVSGR
ncbi:MAG: hypothetical protein NVS2B7_30330 [Herpetosiphon sp.]